MSNFFCSFHSDWIGVSVLIAHEDLQVGGREGFAEGVEAAGGEDAGFNDGIPVEGHAAIKAFHLKRRIEVETFRVEGRPKPVADVAVVDVFAQQVVARALLHLEKDVS